MTQQVAKARVLLPVTTGLEDQVSFDFVFEATGSDTNLDFTGAVNPTQQITAFLNTAATGMSQAMSHWMPINIATTVNGASITWTDITGHLDGTPAGSPFRVDNFTAQNGGIGPLPGQVSICIGYRADYGTAVEHGPMVSVPSDDDAIDQGAPPTHMGQERPRSRLRGRLFFGPICAAALISSSGEPVAVLLTDAQIAFQNLARTQNLSAHNQFNLVQWSRRNASVQAVRWLYVNEGFATQRRRHDTSAARVHPWVQII